MLNPFRRIRYVADAKKFIVIDAPHLGFDTIEEAQAWRDASAPPKQQPTPIYPTKRTN